MATKTVTFEIRRQANPDAPAEWERFDLELRPGMNVTSALMEIAANPVTAATWAPFNCKNRCPLAPVTAIWFKDNWENRRRKSPIFNIKDPTVFMSSTTIGQWGRIQPVWLSAVGL